MGEGGAAKILPRCFDTFRSVTTTKKVVNFFFGGGSAPPEKMLTTRMRKGPPLYIGIGTSEWLIRPCSEPAALTTSESLIGGGSVEVVVEGHNYTLCPQKTAPFYFSNNSVKN